MSSGSHIRHSRSLGPVAAFMLAIFVTGCAAVGNNTPVSIFDLSAPTNFPGLRSGTNRQVLVQPPVAIRVLDTDRIMVRSAGGAVSYYPDAQWSDQLPKLLQARMVEAFENTGRVRAVGRPGQGLFIDFQVVSDLRAFGIDTTEGDRAVIDLSIKLVNDRNGKVTARRIFQRDIVLATTDIGSGVTALNTALEQTLAEIVVWVLARI